MAIIIFKGFSLKQLKKIFLEGDGPTVRDELLILFVFIKFILFKKTS